ncbi:MAG: hypothetical protein RL076_2420 [Chloroflexota bacterium]
MVQYLLLLKKGNSAIFDNNFTYKGVQAPRHVRVCIVYSTPMRLEITRKTDLAIRALIVLDQQAQKLKASMLAGHISTTSGFLSQVMTPLVARGWVRSDPGPTGGYTLRVQTSAISVMDVIEAVEGKMHETRCVLFERVCNADDPCAMHGPWGRARADMIRELRMTTLNQLQLPVV